MKRAQYPLILQDLDKKMILLVGPRQAGKTWLSQRLGEHFKKTTYLNFDVTRDREMILEQTWLKDTELLILDELHKMPQWKNYIKGVYDSKTKGMRLLVTGSARLDVFDRVGDSLAGRYFRHRLLPFSLAELEQEGIECSIDKIIERGGFPEPLLASDDIQAKRWRQQYINSLLSTDVFDIDVVNNLKSMRLVFDMLRSRVGSSISYQSIAEDVSISPTTVKKYIQILESLFIVFIVTPYSKNIARSILKEPKIYFFDTGLVDGNIGAKVENLVANSFLKHIYAKNDYEATEYKLHYLRTKEDIEVDFALVNKDEIEKIFEVKTTDTSISKGLNYFHTKYELPAAQLVYNARNDSIKNGIEILNLEAYLRSLRM